MKYVEWTELFCSKENGPETLGVINLMAVEDVVKWQRWREPRYTSDEEALDDFVVVNWGRIVEYDPNR